MKAWIVIKGMTGSHRKFWPWIRASGARGCRSSNRRSGALVPNLEGYRDLARRDPVSGRLYWQPRGNLGVALASCRNTRAAKFMGELGSACAGDLGGRGLTARLEIVLAPQVLGPKRNPACGQGRWPEILDPTEPHCSGHEEKQERAG